jgi:hypothetical protein
MSRSEPDIAARGAGAVASAAGQEPSAPRPDDHTELLLWSLMDAFERLALTSYEAHSTTLATPEKRQLVARLAALGLDGTMLARSALGAPASALLTHARTSDEVSALIVQGLVLEHMGQAIYRIAQASDRASAESRALAATALVASMSVIAAASARLATRVGTGDALYAVFAEVSHAPLGALDALAEPVDEVFGERFGLRFADVMGEFVADLIGACTALGMQRRKVVAQLAGASMGL